MDQAVRSQDANLLCPIIQSKQRTVISKAIQSYGEEHNLGQLFAPTTWPSNTASIYISASLSGKIRKETLCKP
jgi:hypothetical protein